ncbi:hypothetical protein PACTADRAFT_49404 [Pachysolen tannophilus NRRL Y-2460]|uniref:NADH:ubiquinone oxidoreductase 30kDa subunit domain-containing protein n=1 Tax=Pachysolen tannophilus NRRL Y-2460 TaxID=669874 RepID=A0A1E4TW53_PACTA|nr:hypothetical protein PACTADRAFT_49404 [Pachysolen tannophilus NRRL Y-2460]
MFVCKNFIRRLNNKPVVNVIRNSRSFSSTLKNLNPIAGEDHELTDLRKLPRKNYDDVELNVPVYDPNDKYKDQIEELHKFGRYLMSCLPKFIQQFTVWKDELTICVGPTGLIPVMTFLRDHGSCQFKACMDITAADYPSKTNRFDVVYNLLSVRLNSRIRVKTYASEISPVPSVTELFKGVHWAERETYDMFGIFFEGNADLRRILTDYGFEGHPMRKDFPTSGYTEIRYDSEKRRIVYEPLELTQAWRNFTVGSSVWDQVGDGKDATPEAFKLAQPKPEPEPENKDEKKK